jgi:hypothetical protein
LAKEEFLNEISMFFRFLLQVTPEKFNTDFILSSPWGLSKRDIATINNKLDEHTQILRSLEYASKIHKAVK